MKTEDKKDYRLLSMPEVTRVEIELPPAKGWEVVFKGKWDTKEGARIWADFRTLTVADEWMLARLTRKVEMTEDDKKEDSNDYEERKLLILRFLLLDWNLDVDLKHEKSSGWLTEECWRKVLKLPGTVLEALIGRYQDALYISGEEEETIVKQSTLLFSKHGKGVKNACEAVSLYCTLGNFWEKFGLNRFDMAKLPYREYLMIRMVLGHDIERQRQVHQPKKSLTRIAGAGGKTRPSRGVVVEE